MLNLHFAPSLDLLVADLRPLLLDAWQDPFMAPQVIVPSPVAGKWLQMRLAEGAIPPEGNPTPDGCVANLPMPTIEHFLWKILEPDATWELLDQGRMQQVVCALLDEPCIEKKEFESVKAYLTDRTGRIDALKRVQLSARIAHRLLEYEYNRPGVWRSDKGVWQPEGIDGSWMRNRRYLPEMDADESWQAELYRNVRRCFAKQEKGGNGTTAYLTLPQLYRLRRHRGDTIEKPWNVAPAAIFLFGVTKVSHFHRNLFVEISQMPGIDMHVFLTNPCAEFWEDVDTRRGIARRSWRRDSKNPPIAPRTPDDYGKEELADCTNAPLPPDHKLLELWGNAGKENIFLWCQDAQWNFDYRTRACIDDACEPQTILEALQYSLLRRESTITHPEKGLMPDGSLQILACPDRGREIEEIREQILDCIRDGGVTMLNEIVVYLPDVAAYVPHIQRVFGRFGANDPRSIPFCILGASGKTSIASRGLSAFIDIAESRFDRAHLFELLRNPIVQASRRIDAASVSVWEQWADGCAMYRGYDRAHREEMGDGGATITDAHTFGIGMARMLMGDIAEGPVSLGFKQLNHDVGAEAIPIVPYRDFETSDRVLLEQFCATLDELHADTSMLRNSILQGVEPALVILSELVMQWFGAIPENGDVDTAAESSVVRSFLDAAESIALQQDLCGRAVLPAVEFFALLRGCLPDELPAARTAAWTAGITFAPLRPSMIIPHRVIFAAGLDADAFPGSNERPAWDLLSRKRIIGDSDRVRDNRFAFLELVHAARERLVLLYRARDMRKDEELQPSSVVLELATFLRDQGFAERSADGKDVCSLMREIPWITHESLTVFAASGRACGSWNPVDHELARRSAAPRVNHRHDRARAGSTPAEGAARFATTLADFRMFFINPLEYHLRRTLGLDNRDEGADMSATDEPLDSGDLALSMIRRELVKTLLCRVFPVHREEGMFDEEALKRLAHEKALAGYSLHAAAGAAPEAMIGEMEKDFVALWAVACVAPVLELKTSFPDHYLLEHADPALDRQDIPGSSDVLLANGKQCTVECRHDMVLVPRGGSAADTAAIITIRKDGRAAENPALWLEGALQWRYESKHMQPRRLFLVQFNRGDGGAIACDLDSAACRPYDDAALTNNIDRWLADILGEMLIERCRDHLPFICIQKYWERLTVNVMEEDLASDRPAYRPYLAAFDLADARLPELSDDMLRSVALRRYGPMIEGWLIDEGGRRR